MDGTFSAERRTHFVDAQDPGLCGPPAGRISRVRPSNDALGLETITAHRTCTFRRKIKFLFFQISTWNPTRRAFSCFFLYFA